MDFRYSTEQVDFRAALRGFLTETAPMARVREVAIAGGHDHRLWRRLCGELELPALHLQPEHGGVGGTLVEAAIAFEELGRALTPVPLAGSVFAIESVLRMGNAEQRQRLLPGLVSGERIGTFTAVGPDAADPTTATVRADRTGHGSVLHGECAPVIYGTVADVLVVPAETGDAVTPYVVAADAPGVTVEPLPSFDTTRPVARLTFTNTPAEALTGTQELDRVLDTARVLLAAEMLGGAEACLETSVEYAGSRRQFDRSIGSFQAVKHACAEMMIEIDATRVAVMFAAMSATDPNQLAITAPLVKAQAADTFALCAGSAIQVHGGIAFTWEHDIHLYYRRAKTTEALFGSSTHHRALLADRAGL